ncbi:conserved hypothetical protein [Microsporum canis CBS 113480]|uniref:HMG box domain-containing protein n=1 Tax=Arthroderma otae (strain ATCC MYA-4605 / CBS 113480) TaxID=554155 RepID=C5FN82_ARTOC|nr:conserved hypothetical protein [Microsporum canis CBS 113480]EEQ31318.1 conserved hypothetical protein [Microsporum canis CBS 113480]
MASEPDSNHNATNPQNASMAPHPNPPSIEAAYKRKCIALKKRLNEVEAHNEAMRLRNAQGIRYIQKMRLESCILLERLSVLMGMADGSGRGESEVTSRAMALVNESGSMVDEEHSKSRSKRAGEDLDALGDESDGSSGHPPTPQERPLRLKKSRKSDERPATQSIGDSTNDTSNNNVNPLQLMHHNHPSLDQLTHTTQADQHHSSSGANPQTNDLSSFPPATSGRELPHRYVSAFEAFTNHKRESLTEALIRSYGQRITDEDIDRVLVQEWDALDPSKKREFGERLEKDNGA